MSIDVTKVLPAAFTLNAAEIDAILEIAYLATAANGSLSRDELRTFRRLAHHLPTLLGNTDETHPFRMTSSEGKEATVVPPLEELISKIQERVSDTDPSQRLALLAKSLTRPDARRAAYRVAYAISLSDLDRNEDEEEFEADLATTLGLLDELDTLKAQVLETVVE